MKHVYLYIILLFLLLSCLQSNKQNNQSKTFLILFDVSLSVSKPEVRLSYKAAYKKIFAKVDAGDNLLVGYITDKSINQLELPVAFKYKPFQPTTDNEIGIANEKAQYLSVTVRQKDSINHIVDSILTKVNRNVQYTDIFSSLNLAEKLFGQYPNSQKVLIIFSDMEEDSPSIHFTSANLNGTKITQIIENQRKENLLPDLSNVKVFVVGANSSDYQKYEQVESFWLRYLQECKADINKKNYNSVLANFEI